MKRYLVFILAFTLILLAVPNNASALTLKHYERIASTIWHTDIEGRNIAYIWTTGEADTEHTCGISAPSTRVVGCAVIGGNHIWLDWFYWRATTRVERCAIFSHEVGHTLGWKHGDAVFIRMERRAYRVCSQWNTVLRYNASRQARLFLLAPEFTLGGKRWADGA